VRFLCALKKTAQQKKYDPHHGQDSHRRAGGEKRLAAIDGVASVLTTTGAKRAGFGNNTGGHVAQFTIVLDRTRRRESDRVLAAAQGLGYLVPGADY